MIQPVKMHQPAYVSAGNPRRSTSAIFFKVSGETPRQYKNKKVTTLIVTNTKLGFRTDGSTAGQTQIMQMPRTAPRDAHQNEQNASLFNAV